MSLNCPGPLAANAEIYAIWPKSSELVVEEIANASALESWAAVEKARVNHPQGKRANTRAS